jgi:hypothetical protein
MRILAHPDLAEHVGVLATVKDKVDCGVHGPAALLDLRYAPPDVLTDRDGGMIAFQSNDEMGTFTSARAGMAMVGSDGLPVFSTPKPITRSLLIAKTTICLGVRRAA